MSTETLNARAAEALAKLERALLPLPLIRAVTRYEVAAFHYDELVARPASTLSPAEFDSIGQAQQTMADMFGVLAKAGRTDLLAPLETATRYRYASECCRRLSASGDVDGCLEAQDEMAMCRCHLAKAGRLDLIGGAA
ncbi:hypothetical protein [Streptomyces capitiformicae]|uniref:Uncharacterized protein n=1 Tax=Streptomyces capitiformicae TaxID=2014920 RepID=A0A919GPA8_9ACTN|nr:hypothetical protein [Streptomyces capitiformicae]GHH87869.1 hypothetical protein GCM10017771_30820 [Streptomyces capitiformicae]